jgi:hypothetical protein
MAKPKKQMDEAQELETVLGLSHKTVTVRGEEVRVEEFELEQLPQLLKLVKDLLDDARGASVTESLLMQSGEIGIKLAMLATGKPREWFSKMPLGDGLAVYSAVIAVNQSFFAQTKQFTELIELLGGLFAPVMKAGSGRGSSTLSPAPVIPLNPSGDSSSAN